MDTRHTLIENVVDLWLAEPSGDAPVRTGNAAELGPELHAVNRLLPILVLDAAGTTVRANSQFLRQHGLLAEAVAGRNIRQFTRCKGGDDAMDRLWDGLRKGQPGTLDIARSGTDGSQRWYQASYTPLRGGDGMVGQVVELCVDITERVRREHEAGVHVAAIEAAGLMARFGADGGLLRANDAFHRAFGHPRTEAQALSHAQLLDPSYAGSRAYAEFWSGLLAGRQQTGEFVRIARDGSERWLQGTYVPLAEPGASTHEVVLYAMDVSEQRRQNAEYLWHVAALHRSHCMLTFDRHGVVIDANDAMLEALGYRLDEVIGRHHRMFVEPSYSHGAEYAAFWRALDAGRFQSGQYRRIGKHGRELWLQANYSPVFDASGALVKVVSYASVITDEKRRQAMHQGQIAAIDKAQCVIAFDLDGTIVDANDNFLDAMGYRLSDVRGHHHRMFVEAEVAAGADYQDFWSALARGEYQAGEFKRIGRDGREVWLQASYNPILDSSGRPTRVVKYAIDVTAQKLQQADVQSQIRAIHTSQGVVSFATDGTILQANANFLNAVGYTLDELKGRHHRVLVDALDRDADEYAAFWDTLRDGRFVSGRYRRIGKDGRRVWLQASYNPVFDLNGKLWKIVKFATDVTSDVALAEAFEDAKRQAQHDPATSLPNRARLSAFMAAALQLPSMRLAVLYLDLDRFKPINDTHGHHVGDRVLGEIADRLRRSLRGDQLAARVGGDEFVVALPNLGDDALETYCQQLLESLQQPIHYESSQLQVGVSIGVAVSPADGITPDELLRAADAALYRVKDDGGGGYRFHGSEMNARLLANRRMTEDMRRGIADGQFYLEFQPRYDAHSQTIRSAEALVRWEHPELGRVGPDRFIPLAERSGLIVPLGEWVIEAACQAAVRWPQLGVSVNVSPVQFRDGRLAERIARVLADTGVAPERLEVEITEGVLMEDAPRAAAALRELKQLGVRLAMDDFGTGYSSLSYLRQFPFDVIKIDRQFISDIEHREGSRDIVRAILALGRALGLSVTAEGVETNGQLRILVEDDCAEVQGFLLSRPIKADAVDALLQTPLVPLAPRALPAPRRRRN